MTTQTREPLTAKQQEILDFIRSHLAEKGRPPTLRGIAQAIGVSSMNGIAQHLKALARKGYVRRNEFGRACGIELVEDEAEALPVAVKLCGGSVLMGPPPGMSALLLSPTEAIALGLALVQAARRAQAVARA